DRPGWHDPAGARLAPGGAAQPRAARVAARDPALAAERGHLADRPRERAVVPAADPRPLVRRAGDRPRRADAAAGAGGPAGRPVPPDRAQPAHRDALRAPGDHLEGAAAQP